MGEARRRKQLLQDPNYKISIIVKQLAASLNRSPLLKIVIFAFLGEALVYELQPNLMPQILFDKVTNWLNKNSNIGIQEACFEADSIRTKRLSQFSEYCSQSY